MALAAVLLVQGSKNLGNSLTPFPKPRADNVLKTGGAYAAVRHPHVRGSSSDASASRCSRAIPPDALHHGARRVAQRQGDREEDYLCEMHGADVYGKYATQVPRTRSRLDGMKAVVQISRMGSSRTSDGGAAAQRGREKRSTD